MSAVSIIRRGMKLSPEFASAARGLVLSGVLIGLGRVMVPVLFQQIIDRGLLADTGVDRGTLIRLSLVTLGVVLVVTALSVGAEIRLITVSERGLARLRGIVLRRAVDLSLAEHATERQGDLVSRTTGDIETLTRFLDWGAYAWLVDLNIALIAIIVMFIYSWPLALVATVCLVAMTPVLVELERRQQRRVTVWRERTAELLSDTTESIAGGDVVRAFGQQEPAIRRMHGSIDSAYDAQIHLNRIGAVLFTVSDMFGTIAISAVILTSVWLGVDGPGLGATIAILFLIQIVLTPIAELTEVIDMTATAMAGWERVIDLANRPHAIPSAAHPEKVASGPLSIDVEQVSFAYGEHPVLHDVSLSVPAGTSVAIVGATGSGKTTLARLLCRLADPDDGVVRLGGVDLRQLGDADRRAAVRMVPQDGFLFATTVRENILMGRDDATEADIEQAVADLGLQTWIESLPTGLDTTIGPSGDGLSVGERQLVAVTRAALADPGLLILDEATSSLDPATEQAMSEALERLKQGRTTVTVAHRLSTAERSQLVLVFEAGTIVEHGSHPELVAANGVYARLHQAWTRGASL